MRHALLALLSLCMLSACDSTASLKALRHAEPSSDPYQAALAAGYQQYAEEKVATYDWWVSKYFADKGLMAAYGRDVPPEEPARWRVAQSLQGELDAAREKLLAAIAAGKASNPRTTAAAAVLYDRWVVLASYGWDTAHIEAAREAFLAAMGELESPATAAEDAPAPVETTSSVLYFPFDSYALSDSAKAALNELIKYLKNAGPVKITINGHADRVGSDSYNMVLSEERATYVMKALSAAGIPKSEMQYFAFGASDPAVPTPNNVPEPKNRRVQIFLE